MEWLLDFKVLLDTLHPRSLALDLVAFNLIIKIYSLITCTITVPVNIKCVNLFRCTDSKNTLVLCGEGFYMHVTIDDI